MIIIMEDMMKKQLQKGKLRKRLAALLVGLSLTAGILGGCQKNQSNPGESQFEQEEGREQAESGTGGSITERAKGRYVEKELPAPEEAKGESFLSLFRGQDGILELYTSIRENPEGKTGARRFLWQGDEWMQDEGWWERVKPEEPPLALRRVFFGLDGKYYFSGMTTDGSYIYHLYQIKEDETGTAIGSSELLGDLFYPKQGNSYGWIPPKTEVGAEGNILLYSTEEAVYYRPDGTKLFAMEKAWGGSSEDSEGYLTDREFVTRTDQGVTRYSLDNGQKIETIFYEGLNQYGEGLHLFDDGTGGIYAVNRNGLAHVNAGGSLWELIIDGSMNTMGMESCFLTEFLAGDNEEYYGVFTKNTGHDFFMVQYIYDPDMEAVPPTAITVYSLKDNSTVRQAAALFQQAYPHVRVEVLNGENQNGDVSEDTIRALNTELLSGKGADVLILDELPFESYQEKEILMDLRQVFEKIQKESPLMEQVIGDFTQEDGAIYAMPARISLPVAIGEHPAIQALSGLDEMAADGGEHPLFRMDNYENFLRRAACLQYQELFGREEGLTEMKLVKYLETVKALGDKCGAKAVFTQEEMEQYPGISNYIAPFGIKGNATNFDQSFCDCGDEVFDGVESAMIPMAVWRKHPEAVLSTINNIYFPSTLAGVNQATKQPELAQEFVAMLFSLDVQKEYFHDGFPVNIQAQQENCAYDNGDLYIGIGYGEYDISAGWPSLEERQKIYALLKEVSFPVMLDETVMEMIISGSQDYFAGKITSAQAASAIGRQLALYQAEQE